MMQCSNCGSNDLLWYVGLRSANDVPDGRLRLNEVQPIAYLACEECSETLRVIGEDQINKMLNSRGTDASRT
jgi:hypothetical protein